ncbi:MAG: hypothetical protein IPK83_20900 [Planctomycetes bacterium]|nr:hypothetical protein [Planctomycetota bacterium]
MVLLFLVAMRMVLGELAMGAVCCLAAKPFKTASFEIIEQTPVAQFTLLEPRYS